MCGMRSRSPHRKAFAWACIHLHAMRYTGFVARALAAGEGEDRQRDQAHHLDLGPSPTLVGLTLDVLPTFVTAEVTHPPMSHEVTTRCE